MRLDIGIERKQCLAYLQKKIMQQTRKTTVLLLWLQAWLNCTRKSFMSNYVAKFDHTFH